MFENQAVFISLQLFNTSAWRFWDYCTHS